VPERAEVVLVSKAGRVLGTAGKLEAHEAPGLLHLAFSVFIFNESGETLLQRRAASKYHFGGVWANACCSHPEPGEELIGSAERRLHEELGLAADLADAGTFVYRAVDPVSGRVEHELDHVLVGVVPAGGAARVSPHPEEVDDVAWVQPAEVVGAGLKAGYAPWFAEALAVALAYRLTSPLAGDP
jgi:isopentenyl-diphosphate delta-isomerase